MKAQNVKALIYGFILLLVQCKSENDADLIVKKDSEGLTKITGVIRNRNFYPDTKEITIHVSHISGSNYVTKIMTPIRKDGTFSFEIDLARPQDVTMPPYLDFLYLVPGDSLHIVLNFRNLFDIRLSGGKSAEINRDFYKYFDATGYRTTHFNYSGVGTAMEMTSSWEEIREKIDSERNEYLSRRQKFLQKTPVCSEVAELTEAMIELDYYTELAGVFGNRKKFLYKKDMPIQSMMTELDEVAAKYFNSKLYSHSHFKFITSVYTGVAMDLKPLSPDNNFVDWTKDIAKTDTIRDFMLTTKAGSALLNKDLENFEEISSNVKNEYLHDRLMHEYRVVWEKMVNPENISASITGVPKDFVQNISLDNKNIIAKNINPNKGKVQVINISASWCSPCKEVLNQAKLLEDEYAGKDVSFSFISVTPDTKETREMYLKRGIADTTIYFSSKEETTYLMKTFSPMGFPYGILVNRKGVVVDYGPHIRPGTQLLRDKINLLLEQDNLIKK